MVSLIVSCYVMLGWYHWEARSFLQRNAGAVDLGKRRNWDWEVEEGETESVCIV